MTIPLFSDHQRGPCMRCTTTFDDCQAMENACCDDCVQHYGSTHPSVAVKGSSDG